MIETTTGNLLEADAQALVNTVNTVGVMGKGIALQFKRAFPSVYKQYEKDCKAGKVVLGQMHIVDRGGLDTGPRWIINFPTKKHWRSKSQLSSIDSGLENLVGVIRRLEIKSIAVPPLGCGYGGLNWKDVRPRIQEHLGNCRDVRVLVYEPKGSPVSSEMVDRTPRPKMTEGSAALIRLMQRYLAGLLDPFITLLEVHKCMYFLKEAGELPKLKYDKGIYGPYSSNLRHSLSRIEGHLISGFGEGADSPDVPLQLLGGAAQEAEAFLLSLPSSSIASAIERVGKLIDGYEDPQGMELLGSVHWVVMHDGVKIDPDSVIEAVQQWSPRKKNLLKPASINKALNRLSDCGWL